MSRALVHRLTRLEQQARARDLPRWDAVHAAEEQLRTSARVHVDAVLHGHGHAAPDRDEAQHQADKAMLDRWCTAHGTRIDWVGAKARLCAKLKVMAARYATDSSESARL